MPGKLNELVVGIKGGGDIASGLAWMLHRANLGRLYIMEVDCPSAVRRCVSFCEAVYDGRQIVEGVAAVRAEPSSRIDDYWKKEIIPVYVDPEWKMIERFKPDVVVDAILAKKNLGTRLDQAPLTIGLGPGFTAREDVHVVIETNRGHNLGRIIFDGSAEKDTGAPGSIDGYSIERLLRSPAKGVFTAHCRLGDLVKSGDLVGNVEGAPIRAPIDGMLRGMIRPGVKVVKGMKLGDIDPRGPIIRLDTISDKARALGGSVLGAILNRFNTK